MWLPCDIEVIGFPAAGLTDFEFYVPIDEHSHLYFQLVGKPCKNEQERAQHRNEVKEKWTPWAFEAFNGDDVLARLGMEDGYENTDGWNEETLVRTDSAVIAWRQFASKHARGIQTARSAAR
jgi:carbazole 1,9a-dioxygenase